jgi:hypothetical protein
MSGFEVAGALAGAFTFLEVLGKVSKYLRNLLREVEHAGTVADNLMVKLDLLRKRATTVQRAARFRTEQARWEDQDQVEVAVWGVISTTVHQCEVLLKEYEGKIREIAPVEEQLDWLGKAQLQRKIKSSEPGMLELEKKINCHLVTLDTTILIAHVYDPSLPWA